MPHEDLIIEGLERHFRGWVSQLELSAWAKVPTRREQPSASCYGLFSVGYGDMACWSNPIQLFVRTNANDWSGRMQTDGQVECNFAKTPA